MKKYDNYTNDWKPVDIPLAIESIKENLIVKCKIDNQEPIFNDPNGINPKITLEMIKSGKWYAYTGTN